MQRKHSVFHQRGKGTAAWKPFADMGQSGAQSELHSSGYNEHVGPVVQGTRLQKGARYQQKSAKSWHTQLSTWLRLWSSIFLSSSWLTFHG